MTDPTDIKALDEYLKGDSDVSRSYRELGRDEVPPELDQRVLAAARDAVENAGARRSRSWLRWSAPVALAASVVLVLTVVLQRGPDYGLTSAPAQAPAEPQVRDVAGDKEARAAAERKVADEAARRKAQESSPVYIEPVNQARPPAFAVREPAPAPVAPPRIEVEPVMPPPAITAEQESDRALARSETAAPEAPAVAQSQSASQSQKPEAVAASDAEGVAISNPRARRAPITDTNDPAAWLEEIRDLRRAGKAADADREWDLFRKAFPDFVVADDDIARSKR